MVSFMKRLYLSLVLFGVGTFLLLCTMFVSVNFEKSGRFVTHHHISSSLFGKCCLPPEEDGRCVHFRSTRKAFALL